MGDLAATPTTARSTAAPRRRSAPGATPWSAPGLVGLQRGKVRQILGAPVGVVQPGTVADRFAAQAEDTESMLATLQAHEQLFFKQLRAQPALEGAEHADHLAIEYQQSLAGGGAVLIRHELFRGGSFRALQALKTSYAITEADGRRLEVELVYDVKKAYLHGQLLEEDGVQSIAPRVIDQAIAPIVANGMVLWPLGLGTLLAEPQQQAPAVSSTAVKGPAAAGSSPQTTAGINGSQALEKLESARRAVGELRSLIEDSWASFWGEVETSASATIAEMDKLHALNLQILSQGGLPGEIAAALTDFEYDFAKGFLKNGYETVKGIVKLGYNAGQLIAPAEWLFNPEDNLARLETLGGVATALSTEEGWATLWSGIKKPYVEAWARGDYGEAFGYAAFELVDVVFGSKGTTKVAKIEKVGAILAETGELVTKSADELGTMAKLEAVTQPVAQRLEQWADEFGESATKQLDENAQRLEKAAEDARKKVDISANPPGEVPRLDPNLGPDEIAKVSAPAKTVDILRQRFGDRLQSRRGALEEVLRRTADKTVPTHRRAAAMELRTLIRYLTHGAPDGRKVLKLEVVPSARGSSTPDFVAHFADGKVERLEVATLTAAPRGILSTGPGSGAAARLKLATETAARADVSAKDVARTIGRKAKNQQLKAPLAGVPTGGAVIVSTTAPGFNAQMAQRAVDLAVRAGRLGPHVQRIEISSLERVAGKLQQVTRAFVRSSSGDYVLIP